MPAQLVAKPQVCEGVKGWDQWREWSRDCRPADIPSHPDVTYADEGWESMADWLGYGKEP